MIRSRTDFSVSLGEASKGAYLVVVASLSMRNHHHGCIPAWVGASTEQKNVRPESTNWNSCFNLPLERMIKLSLWTAPGVPEPPFGTKSCFLL